MRKTAKDVVAEEVAKAAMQAFTSSIDDRYEPRFERLRGTLNPIDVRDEVQKLILRMFEEYDDVIQ